MQFLASLLLLVAFGDGCRHGGDHSEDTGQSVSRLDDESGDDDDDSAASSDARRPVKRLRRYLLLTNFAV
jgi:hypothetical protein